MSRRSCRDEPAYTSDPHEVIRSCWSITSNMIVWPGEGLYMRNRVLTCAVLALAVTAPNTPAQVITNMVKRAGVGGSVGGIFTSDDDVNTGVAFGVNAGLAPAPGFGPTIGLGWYQADLTLSGVSGDREVGRLRVRPLMAGVGYTWVKDRVAVGMSVNAGISFNSIRLNDEYPKLLRPRYGSGLTRAIVSPSGLSSGSNTPLPGRSASIRAPGISLPSSTTSSRRRWVGSRTSGTRAASTYSPG